MTFGIRNIVAVTALRRGERGDAARRGGFFGTKEPLLGRQWKDITICRAVIEEGVWTLDDVYTYLVGAHVGHALDFIVALLCYFLLYSDGKWMHEATELRVTWVARIYLYNLVCEILLYGFWHYTTYVSGGYNALMEEGKKYNSELQYESDRSNARMFTSSSGHLEREIFFNTLGWLQSASWQVLFTLMWARGWVPIYTDWFSMPTRSFLILFLIAYWREVHFYCIHRCMHPWRGSDLGLKDGDIGAFLYRYVHSLHHKSYNPGPWAGLSMHPVEHLFYYSAATLLPLIAYVHPFHFLYTKFHCDIAPLGGHDGMENPGGDADFHYLHHAKFECNYGVPFPINLDKLFGTWVDHKQTSVESGDAKTAPLLTGEKQLDTFTLAEVAAHTFCENCWIVLYGQVLNISGFLKVHPGGEKVLMTMAGKDATSTFEKIHARSGGWRLVSKWVPDSIIGRIEGWAGPEPPQVSEAAWHFPGPQLLFSCLVLLSCLVVTA